MLCLLIAPIPLLVRLGMKAPAYRNSLLWLSVSVPVSGPVPAPVIFGHASAGLQGGLAPCIGSAISSK